MKFKEDLSGSGSGLPFLKMKSGQSIEGVFRGDPYDFKVHWTDNHSVLCVGYDKCEHCKKGDKPRFRFRLNFIMKENGINVAKVFEQGWETYQILRALHQGDYNLERHIMKVTRTGDGKDTKYTVLPKPNGLLNEAAEIAISKVQLHLLTHEQEAESESIYAPDVNFVTNEDIPF